MDVPNSTSTTDLSYCCPICLEIFEVPKIFSCGHSVCQNCEEKLAKNSNKPGHIICPKCKKESLWSPNSKFPVNYDLQSIISDKKQKSSNSCESCLRNFDDDSMYLCLDCNRLHICHFCAIKTHKDHSLQSVADLKMQNKKELAEWWEKKVE